MGKDNIIHFNFREKRFEHPEGREKPGIERDRDPEHDFASVEDMRANLEQSTADMNLKDLRKLYASPEEIQQEGIEISKMFERELVDVLAISSPMDWAQRPAYYRALYNEILRRLGDL